MNKRHFIFAALVLAVLSCACGEAGQSGIGISIVRGDHLTDDPNTFEMRIYGANASCIALIDDVQFSTDSRCATGANIESGTCYITNQSGSYVAGSTTSKLVVPAGERHVIVFGTEAGFGVVAAGCSSVTIEEGKLAQVTVVLSDV